jgi:hypothetical protein
MININKIKGKSVKYIGCTNVCFTKWKKYKIGYNEDSDSLFTIDDEGDYHPFFVEHFDVADYIEKPSMVGKYVRYIVNGSDFIRKDDIGIVVKEHKGGDFDVRWLNPIQAHTEHVPAWYASRSHVEVIS